MAWAAHASQRLGRPVARLPSTLRCHKFRVGGGRGLMYNPDFPGKLGL